jgi:hypothetical protein
MSEHNEQATFRTEISFDRLSEVTDPIRILKMAQDLKEGKEAQRVGELTYAVASAVIARRADEMATELINNVGKVITKEGFKDQELRTNIENARHLREAAYNARDEALTSTLGTKIAPSGEQGIKMSQEFQNQIASSARTDKLLDSMNDTVELFARGAIDLKEIKTISAIAKTKADQLKDGVNGSISQLSSDNPIRLLGGIAVTDMNRLSTQCDNLKMY